MELLGIKGDTPHCSAVAYFTRNLVGVAHCELRVSKLFYLPVPFIPSNSVMEQMDPGAVKWSDRRLCANDASANFAPLRLLVKFVGARRTLCTPPRVGPGWMQICFRIFGKSSLTFFVVKMAVLTRSFLTFGKFTANPISSIDTKHFSGGGFFLLLDL